MTAQTLPITDDLTIPRRDDGSPWPYVMTSADELVVAETISDLVARIIDGYDQIPTTPEGHDDALWARYKSAVTIADDVQATLCAQAANEGWFTPAEETEDTLTALFSLRAKPIALSTWTHRLSLVLIRTDYAPFTDHSAPVGNVRRIDPSQELAFLQSLANLGLLALHEAEG